jgi:hypothetical protein
MLPPEALEQMTKGRAQKAQQAEPGDDDDGDLAGGNAGAEPENGIDEAEKHADSALL